MTFSFFIFLGDVIFFQTDERIYNVHDDFTEAVGFGMHSMQNFLMNTAKKALNLQGAMLKSQLLGGTGNLCKRVLDIFVESYGAAEAIVNAL